MKSNTAEEIDKIAAAAGQAFLVYRNSSPQERAAFLRETGRQIDTRRKELAAIAQRETALALDRLDAEITRTVNQCFLFSDMLLEGSWVRAIIDTALPEKKPLPQPDLRQMQIALGPVAVFGASNFPFAYSVCGGDTVAALAAGCPVVYKVNPGHPETSEQVALILTEVAKNQNLPEGVFQIINGTGNEPGLRLVMHPAIQAVGFTGSLKGGRALFDAAARREEPIPVYAEMGSTNPVFILPEMLDQKGEDIVHALSLSNTSSAGQFCTNPGIMIKQHGPAATLFHKRFATNISATDPATMLNEAISTNFRNSIERIRSKKNVSLLASSSNDGDSNTSAYVFETSASSFLSDHDLFDEMFGPASIQVVAENKEDFLAIARALPGQITASIWGTDNDLEEFKELVDYLQLKAGRIIINGVPTGVEVVHAMNHGGPYPATTDSKFTSVGTQSIYRFTRPVCFQNYPQHLLPAELKDANPLKIMRMVNGKPNVNQGSLT